MLEGAIAVVEDADAIPELCVFLWVGEMKEGVLVGLVGGLKLVLHEKAMAERTPNIAILVVNLNCSVKVIDSLGAGQSWA